MSSAPETFSEHWHLVAARVLALRPAVRAHRQFFRGEKWFVISDAFQHDFFRLSPAAWAFVARLGEGRTVQEVWELCLEEDGDGAPGQVEAIQLLGQLHQANLLRGDVPPDTAALFERLRRRRSRELRSVLSNLFFAQIPLWDPDLFLRRALPLVRPLLSQAGALLWLAAILSAVKITLDHAPELLAQGREVLAPENLFLLYAAGFGVKALHEFGHAFACRRFGGEVHRTGLMLVAFSPFPFVDATASWSFRGRWGRLFVAAAGMIVELFVAALATFVWAGTGPGSMHALAYNVMFVASVTTLLFNANPLLRYDGYFILSDLLEMPSLAHSATRELHRLVERRIFGVRTAESLARSRGEAAFLIAYGLASMGYRLLVFASIVWFVSGRFLLLGAIIALVCVTQWAVLPVWNFLLYLARSPRLQRSRRRAVFSTVLAATALVLLFGVIPFPSHLRAPGVLLAEQASDVFVSAPGVVEKVLADSGTAVHRGDSLVRLQSRDLELEVAAARAERAQARAQVDQALAKSIGSRPLTSLLAAIDQNLRRLEEQEAGLTLRAPHDGVWYARRIGDAIGQWLPRGYLVGRLIQARSFRFTAVVAQGEADALFARPVRGAQVRVLGQAGRVLRASEVQIIPGRQDTLPSPALGWAGGGGLALAREDRTGLHAAEPFFEVHATLPPDAQLVWLHGRTGQIRLDLPAEPLAQRGWRRLGQMRQNRLTW